MDGKFKKVRDHVKNINQKIKRENYTEKVDGNLVHMLLLNNVEKN